MTRPKKSLQVSRYFFVILIATLPFFSAFSQKMPSDYFEEASNYFEDKDLDKALEVFQFIVENYSENELFPRAFYNVGYIHFIQNNYDQAIPIFKVILESNFNEKEKLGGTVMDEPYTIYKHRASRILSDIYYEKKMFDTALHYLALSDIEYPFLHFCGNAYALDEIYTSLRYADIYQKLNQPNKAIEKLLPTVFITIEDNSQVIEELRKLFVSKKDLKQKLDNSLNKIYPKIIKKKKYNYRLTTFYFKFLNVEIELPYDNKYDRFNFKFDKNDKLNKINEIKKTDFYKMIEQL